MSSLSLMRLSGSCRYAHDEDGLFRSTDTQYLQMMKESTVDSGRTESERAKKRYAELSSSGCGKADNIYFPDFVRELHLFSSQKRP